MSEIDKLREALKGKGYTVDGHDRIVETGDPGGPGRDHELEAVVDAYNQRLASLGLLDKRVMLIAPQIPIALGSAEVRAMLRKQIGEIMEGVDGVSARTNAAMTKVPPARIHELGPAQKVVRSERQLFDAAFANFDQHLLQFANLLSSVMKSTREMSASVTRNLC